MRTKSTSVLRSEACNALGASDRIVHSRAVFAPQSHKAWEAIGQRIQQVPDACTARKKRKRALRSEACNALGASDGIIHSRAVLPHID